MTGLTLEDWDRIEAINAARRHRIECDADGVPSDTSGDVGASGPRVLPAVRPAGAGLASVGDAGAGGTVGGHEHRPEPATG